MSKWRMWLWESPIQRGTATYKGDLSAHLRKMSAWRLRRTLAKDWAPKPFGMLCSRGEILLKMWFQVQTKKWKELWRGTSFWTWLHFSFKKVNSKVRASYSERSKKEESPNWEVWRTDFSERHAFFTASCSFWVPKQADWRPENLKVWAWRCFLTAWKKAQTS